MSPPHPGALPTYQAATSRDPWPIIAPYIPAEDLCNTSLTSHALHRALRHLIWASPAPWFTLYDRSAAAGFADFLRCIRLATAETRDAVVSLDLTYRGSELGADLPRDWLSTVIRLLPRLRRLVLDGSPHVDHQTLSALKNASADELELLSMAACPNVTHAGFLCLLRACPALLYLDVSGCKGAVVVTGCQTVNAEHGLINLRFFRCSGSGLDDVAASSLVGSFGTRLRMLDLSHNQLSDEFVEVLLNECILPPSYISVAGPSNVLNSESPRSVLNSEDHGTRALDRLTTEHIKDGELVEILNDLDDVHWQEGLDTLILRGNRLTTQSLIRLLQTCRLQFLYLGSHIPLQDHPNHDVLKDRTELLASLSHYGGPILRGLELRFDDLYGLQVAPAASLKLAAFPQLRYLALTDVPLWLTESQAKAYLGGDGIPRLLAEALAEKSADDDASGSVRLEMLLIRFAKPSTRSVFKPSVHRSYTGLTDGEALSAAAEDDFSFFDDHSVSEGDPPGGRHQLGEKPVNFRHEVGMVVEQIHRDRQHIRNCTIAVEGELG